MLFSGCNYGGCRREEKQGSCYARNETAVAHSCLTLCDPTDCSLPGSSVHGILQERILEWVAISSARGSSQPRDQTKSRASLALAGVFKWGWGSSIYKGQISDFLEKYGRSHNTGPSLLEPSRNCPSTGHALPITSDPHSMASPECTMPGLIKSIIYFIKIVTRGLGKTFFAIFLL